MNGYTLKDVKKQTPKICLVAVKQDGSALRWVKKQTPKLCLAAVKNYSYALYYVEARYKTPEIIELAEKSEMVDAL